MSIENLIVTCITDATANVFSTMLGAEVRRGEATVEKGAPDANDGVVSLIGLAGTWTGAGSVSCSPSMACRVCSVMLMTESSAVNEEVLDAVAELTNMIIGSVKTDLEQHLGPLGLSIPTVVFGRNFRTRSAANADWTVVRFYWDEECLDVRICLTKTERESRPHLHIPSHACTVDV